MDVEIAALCLQAPEYFYSHDYVQLSKSHFKLLCIVPLLYYCFC